MSKLEKSSSRIIGFMDGLGGLSKMHHKRFADEIGNEVLSISEGITFSYNYIYTIFNSSPYPPSEKYVKEVRLNFVEFNLLIEITEPTYALNIDDIRAIIFQILVLIKNYQDYSNEYNIAPSCILDNDGNIIPRQYLLFEKEIYINHNLESLVFFLFLHDYEYYDIMKLLQLSIIPGLGIKFKASTPYEHVISAGVSLFYLGKVPGIDIEILKPII